MKVKLVKSDLLWSTWYPVGSIAETSEILGEFLVQSGFAQVQADSAEVTTPVNVPD